MKKQYDKNKIKVNKNAPLIKMQKSELKKVNQWHHKKISEVKPYYNKKDFNKDQKVYEKVKKKLDWNNNNFRRFEIKAMNKNTKEITKYRKRRANSAKNMKTKQKINSFYGPNHYQADNKKVVLLSKPLANVENKGYTQYMNLRPMERKLSMYKNFVKKKGGHKRLNQTAMVFI